MDSAAKQQLKRLLKELRGIRGRHTELVSVYIPAGYDLNKIIGHLQEEQGTAKNIKDAKTRGNVIDSLEKCIRHLRLFKQTPPHGYAVFGGNVAAQEGKVDLRVWGIEPPEPLNMRIYRCDQRFVIDILEEMMEHKEVYGLILVDRREATLGLLKGSSITALTDLTSGVPGKFKAGGQSAARFERLIHGMAIEFFKRIAESCNKEFLPLKNLKGILLGGPGPTKEEFQDYLNNELKKKILAVQDVTYTDESGLHHLVEKSADILAKEEIIAEKKIMDRFFTMLAKDISKTAYGEDAVRNALSLGAVDILLISEGYDDKKIEEFELLVKESSATLQIISLDTREGQQLRDLGGIA
ncbi:MAG: peptide chain release factor aRF-1, partial [Nanoarchaeota archaeon]